MSAHERRTGFRATVYDKIRTTYLATLGRTVRRNLVYTSGAFEQFERQGIHITDARHFEDPIPSVRCLKSNYPETDETSYPGIDFNAQRQLEYLTTVLPRYRQEFFSFPEKADNLDTYSRLNDSFPQLDALAYWAFIRELRPSRILEIGSGNSSILAYLALRKNLHGKLTVIDPFPRDFTQAFAGQVSSEVEFNGLPVERVDPVIFAGLGENDILFIDGSHVIKIGNDVDYVFNRILPRLNPGVFVHVHDIYLPFQYPRAYFLEEHRFWNEQPALALYLADNPKAEIQFGSAFVLRRSANEVARILPDPAARSGASLWYRRT